VLCSETQIRKKFGQVDTALRLLPFRDAEKNALVLTIQKLMQPGIDGGGQTKPAKVARNLQLNVYCFRHVNFSVL